MNPYKKDLLVLVRIISTAVVFAIVIGFLTWFVVCMPAPDYMYGNEPSTVNVRLKD